MDKTAPKSLAHKWVGDPLPKGSEMTAGYFIALLPDNSREKVAFEISKGVITYTRVGKGVE